MSIINQSYKKDIGRASGPIYFPGEVYSFYMNLNVATSDESFADWILNLVDKDGNVVGEDIGALVQDPLEGLGLFNIYSVFTFPSVLFGWYNFQIYDAVASVIKATSSPVQVEAESDVTNTAIISYRHSENKYGVNFEGLPDFWLRVRVPLIEIGWGLDTERKQYRNVSNRRLRNYNTYSDEVYKLQGYKLDQSMHRALAQIFDHDQVFVNDAFIIPKSVYAVDDKDFSVLSNGNIDVILDDSVSLPSSLVEEVAEFDADWGDEFL